MRAKLGSLLRKTFKEKMKARLPTFREMKDHDDPSGGLRFSQRVNDRLYLQVLLEVSTKRDEFAVTAGWTPVERDFSLSIDEPDPSEPQWFWRLSRPSTGRRKSIDVWWLLQPRLPPFGPGPEAEKAYFDAMRNAPKEEELLSKIEPMVEEVMQRIEQQAIPVFERVKAQNG